MKKTIILSTFVFSAILAFGQAKNTKTKQEKPSVDRSIRPNAGPAPKINIKDSEVFTTSNGITVILSENHKLPRVSINLVMDSDPSFEKEKAGLSDIMGQLIMSGTKNKSKDDLDKEIDYIGADISASSSSIYLTCMTKHLPKAMDLYTDVIFNPSFPQAEFDRIVKQNENALISAKSSPDQISSNVEKKVNFKGHPYGEVMTEATLKNITRDDVVALFGKSFTPKSSYMVIVGDINKEEATALVEKYFSTWSGGDAFQVTYDNVPMNKGNRVIFVNKPGAVQSQISISFPMYINTGDPNQIPLTVLNSIFGAGGFASRLMQNLREDKAYTYGCYSSLRITDNGSWFSASGNFRNEVSDSAITQLLFELNRILSEEVTDEELALTKSSMAGSFARSLESPSTIARFALNIISNNLPKDYYQTYLQKLDAVDKATLLKLAKKYWTASNCNIVVVGNEAILPKLKQFDADGQIEILDAFGDKVVEMKKADISKEDFIEKYTLAVTNSKSIKEANKKLKKVKSIKQEAEMTNPQFPGAMKMTNYFVAPNKDAMSMEMMGMVFQKTFFDGEKGKVTSMQEGKKDLSAEEIAAKKKSFGAFPEINYLSSGMEFEVTGIAVVDGKDCYVVKTNDGNAEGFSYYRKDDFMKVKSTEMNDGQEIETTYSDFKDVNGLMMPHVMNLNIGAMILSGKITSIEVNGKVDKTVFE